MVFQARIFTALLLVLTVYGAFGAIIGKPIEDSWEDSFEDSMENSLEDRMENSLENSLEDSLEAKIIASTLNVCVNKTLEFFEDVLGFIGVFSLLESVGWST